jgi:cyanophycinase
MRRLSTAVIGAWLLLPGACGDAASLEHPEAGVASDPDASRSAADGGAPVDAAWSADAGRDADRDASLPDASLPDASLADGSPPPIDAPPDAPLTLTVFPRVGAPGDDGALPHGPGSILMGGGVDVDSAFVWMHSTITGAASTRGGDVVVLRAAGDNAYDAYVYGLAAFNSVQTLLIPPQAGPADFAFAAGIVSRAEAVFFAGGNQANYVAWNGSPLMAAVQHTYDRGGVIGGTSAGCAILGSFVYDAVAAGSNNVQTADAIANPYEPALSFTRGMLRFPSLAGVVTDPHFHNRDRMGRLAAFMARQVADGAATNVVGVGVDEGNALVVDPSGHARLLQQRAGTGAAFVARGSAADQCAPGRPLVYRGLTVMRLDTDGQTYDFARGCGDGNAFSLGVFGDAPPPYAPSDPYGASGTAARCP